MDRFLRTALRPAVAFEIDGVLTDPDDQDVTVTITRADDSIVVEDEAATIVDPGVYRYNVVDEPTLNRYTAVWSGNFDGDPLSITTEFETVGGFYVSLARLRAQPLLADPVKYPLADLVEAREWFESTLEEYIGVALVPRFGRGIITGSGRCSLGFPHYPIRSVISAGTYSGSTLTAFTEDELADLVVPSETGYVDRRSLGSWSYGVVLVEYEHGFASPPPEAGREALLAITERLVEDRSGTQKDRQYSVLTEAGIVRNTTPGPDHPFGLSSVDAMANRLRDRYRVPAIA